LSQTSTEAALVSQDTQSPGSRSDLSIWESDALLHHFEGEQNSPA